jgi:hypothetical protein
VVAWGLCFPDQGLLTRTFKTETPSVALDAIWAELGETIRVAPQYGLETSRMRWVFSQNLLYAVTRPDGTCLGVLTDTNLDEAARSCIERTLSDFKALRAPPAPG